MSAFILLTGATGFLGGQVARRLIADTDCTVLALVRAPDGVEAQRRLRRAWWHWPELAAAIGARVEILPGDVAAPRLGLDDATYAGLVRRVTHIIHTAAQVRIDRSLDELRAANVQGTANVLALARAAHRDHGLARLAHVSTAYVAGRRRGEVREDELAGVASDRPSCMRTRVMILDAAVRLSEPGASLPASHGEASSRASALAAIGGWSSARSRGSTDTDA